MWPEHSYEGELVKARPPIRILYQDLRTSMRPWADRRSELKWIGSPIDKTRRLLLECDRSSTSPLVRDFYRKETDIHTKEWVVKHASNGTSLPVSDFQDYRHVVRAIRVVYVYM